MKTNTLINLVLATLVAGTLGACSGDQGDATAFAHASDGQADTASAPAGTVAGGTSAAPAVAPALPDLGRSPAASFASQPDRGDLVAYPRERTVRRAGPYTWHRADVSEAHALQAIVDGVLTLTAPSGQQLRFAYERHVEHGSGDWTWIGRALGGDAAQDAIITFGSGAVFGTIHQPGKAPLGLTVEDGASWLVETDVAARAAQSRASGRYDAPDFLVPALIAEPDRQALAAAAPRTSQATVAATRVVDVVVGYTTGFRIENTTNLGNTAPVMTRLNFLVQVTNESYVNSQVDAKVRIVHAMEVGYTDANDNSDALAALTGSDGSETPNLANVDPALKALHSARDQYGADLVSVVRDFQHPEAVSCGVAWLLGGGQSTLHVGYRIYGMSVVSDGSDGGYFCEETTFAHELGHNMGLAHDRDTSMGEDGVLDDDDYGRYPYSFGYRTGPSQGDFFTVMAYSDEQVNGYRVFSNPRVSVCGGFPCGVENQADNARTLVQTLEVITAFSPTIVPEEPDPDPQPDPEDPRVLLKDIDINGDRMSDMMFFNHAQDRLTFWVMNGPTRVSTFTETLDGAYRLVDVGDMDRDRDSDLLFTSDARDLVVGISDGAGYTFTTMPQTYSTSQAVIGLVDVNGDYRNDIVLRDTGTGRLSIWYMDGPVRNAFNSVAMDKDLAFIGHADMDRNRFDEMLWVDPQRNVWVSIGIGLNFQTVQARTATGTTLAHAANYDVVGLQDINGDYRHDIILFSDDLDRLVVWYMEGAQRNAFNAHATTPGMRLVGKGNYDGGRFRGFMWEDPLTHELEMMRSTGFQFTRTALPYATTEADLPMDVD